MPARTFRSRWLATHAAAIAAAVVIAALGAVPAAAHPGPGGQHNAGDVWVDNVGQPSGPGHEMDPHLACVNINLWGAGLEDPSGTFTIDGWHPSGSGTGDFNTPGYHQDQAWPGTRANPGTATWSYGTGGGPQVPRVIAVIDVHQLVANAESNGDAPVNGQGLHFKLQFSQDPQKHKTFWVNCPPPPPPATDCDGDHDNSSPSEAACTPPPVDCDGDHDNSSPSEAACTPPPPATDCDGDHDNSSPTEAACTPPPPATDCDGDHDGSQMVNGVCDGTGGTLGTTTTTPTPTPTPASGVQAATTTHASGVEAATTTNPVTGHPLNGVFWLALALVFAGTTLLAVGLRGREAGN